jgi:isoleucyl-tRNA synthetase
MAPILSFTAEEAWAVFAGADAYAKSDDTIFTQTLWTFPEQEDANDLLFKYGQLRSVRAEVTKQLEEVRASGAIGSSLQAELTIKASEGKYRLLSSLDDDLKFVFITSQAKVIEVATEEEEGVAVTPSTAEKCERCWHYRRDVGHDAAHPGLCARCTSNLFGSGEPRKFA